MVDNGSGGDQKVSWIKSLFKRRPPSRRRDPRQGRRCGEHHAEAAAAQEPLDAVPGHGDLQFGSGGFAHRVRPGQSRPARTIVSQLQGPQSSPQSFQVEPVPQLSVTWQTPSPQVYSTARRMRVVRARYVFPATVQFR